MNEQKNNKRGIFYGTIGVATLAVAIIGATFAYFTASATNSNTITGNMASVKLSLSVEKKTNPDVTKGGMIPMSNGMVEAAVNILDENGQKIDGREICVDDNGNAVCQVYEITLTNSSTAAQFVDGYVALRDKFNITPTDLKGLKEPVESGGEGSNQYTYKSNSGTFAGPVLMRWAQVFCDSDVTSCSTAGTQNLGTNGKDIPVDIKFDSIAEAKQTTGATAGSNQDNIRYLYEKSNAANKGVLGEATISGSTYDVINKNYIRLSDRVWSETGVQTYSRKSDITSALVFNHNIAPNGNVKYYFVVWLSETGTDQTAEKGPEGKNPEAENFFNGNVTFVSAQGSEVSATFSDYVRVPAE